MWVLYMLATGAAETCPFDTCGTCVENGFTLHPGQISMDKPLKHVTSPALSEEDCAVYCKHLEACKAYSYFAMATDDGKKTGFCTLGESRTPHLPGVKVFDMFCAAPEEKVVRIKGDPVLAAMAELVTEADLRCVAGREPAVEGGCGAPAEGWVALMLEGLREAKGACIAAPQVGVSKRAIIMSVPPERVREEPESGSEVSPPVVLLKPVLEPVSKDTKKIEVWESCLSVPGERVSVMRFPEVRWEATRLDGVRVAGTAVGRVALTLQHELDHLDGVLMTDVAVATPENPTRADSLGPITSTAHWELMEKAGYDIRTSMLRGGKPVQAAKTEL